MEKSVDFKVKGILAILFFIGSSLFLSNLLSFLEGFTSISKVDNNTFQQKEIVRDKNKHQTETIIGDEIGLLYFPTLEQSMPIFEGTSQSVLKKGVGHYVMSGMPGENQRIIFSGHRDTVFRSLKKLVIGDEIKVRTSKGEFLYKIRGTMVVDANDKTLLRPQPTETLTLTTCYPFEYIGDAPKRYIITAKRIQSEK